MRRELACVDLADQPRETWLDHVEEVALAKLETPQLRLNLVPGQRQFRTVFNWIQLTCSIKSTRPLSAHRAQLLLRFSAQDNPQHG